jgi:hypothetical protein
MSEATVPRYLLYRCYKCGALITALTIQDIWRSTPDDPPPGSTVPLCTCGSSHISPGNAKWWEELLYPSVWRLWFVEIFKPWLKEKLGK